MAVFFLRFLYLFISRSFVALRVMRRANEEVHSSLVKQRKETKRVKDKVTFLFIFSYVNFYCNFTIVSLFVVV